ncbi:MAG: LamG domain-containing protein [Planctomycetes bacterium]|nr:LamG domain-containing protein [Planctomycetota bacterium]
MGEFHLFAIYCRALTEEEVGQNFDAGPDGGGVVSSGISIDKTPDFQAVIGGANASFNLIVQNPGSSDLSNVIVTDPECDTPILFVGGDDNVDSLLQPGETWVYTCTVNNVTADFTNTADVLADEPGGGTVSDSDSADVTVVVVGDRVQSDLKLLYTFEEGSGTTVTDVSNVLPALDLTIQDPGAVTWLPGGGLSVDAPTVLLSAGAADKVIAASKATNEITLEAWIRPSNVVQDGPARIATNSLDPTTRSNFLLGQGRWGSQPSDVIDVRLATTTLQTSTSTPPGSLTADLHHVVYTRAADGTVTIYIDDVSVATNNVGGDFSNWNDAFAMALANEPLGGRPWLGEFHLFAIYCRALTEEEVGQNFDAGPNAGGVVDPD